MELVSVILTTAKVHFGIGVRYEGSEEKEYGEMLCPHPEIIFFTSSQTSTLDCLSLSSPGLSVCGSAWASDPSSDRIYNLLKFWMQ